MLEATTPRCEYRENPTGIEDLAPRLSWTLAGGGRGLRQTAYEIRVAHSRLLLEEGHGDLWESGKVTSGECTGIAYGGKPLMSRQQCFWSVRVWNQDEKPSPWSQPASWSMGLLDPKDWQAEWISYRDETPVQTSREKLYLPAPRMYRKEFAASKRVRRATIYASALGLYQLRLNGRPVGDSRFTPGWSDYRKRAYYQEYDVTDQVVTGANALAATVAEGWYSGYVGYGLLVGYGPHRTGRYFYGKTPALLAQLELEYDDGSRQVVGTGPDWQVSDQGPIREADILMGETYDARRESSQWDRPGYAVPGWSAAIRASENGSHPAPYHDSAGDRTVDLGFVRPARLQAYPGVPVRATGEIVPTRITEPIPGTYIFDLGQNVSGVVRLKVKGPAGTEVRLRFGEMLHPNGRLMTENLRRARATDRYVLRGDPAGETWTPQFTYHGFQYVELTGYPGQPGTDAVTGVVLHSDTPRTSQFQCSDPVVNKLYANVVRTQLANFFEVPTDCPQRDERLGWMGDAQIYARASTYHADVSAFFTKWLDDVEEAQLPNGAFPDYAPYPMFHGNASGYGTAWMDAGIICPYTVYQAYGDTRVLQRHWASMTRFMEFRRRRDPKLRGVSDGNGWGDWLSLGENTPIEYVDLAYFGQTSRLMAEMAAATGRFIEAASYRKLFNDVQASFQQLYLRPDGSLGVETQSAYALALSFDLLPQAARAHAGELLAERVRKNGSRMATGFLGTRPLLPVLTATGHQDLAVELLQSRKFPSWGYEVANGATSIWERWNSFTIDQGFGDAGMNSFSHYSFGAVSEWMFQSLAGIDTDGAGFRKLILRPGPPSTAGTGAEAPTMDSVSATYDSPRGRIVSSWQRSGDRFRYNVTVPPNVSATLYIPAVSGSMVLESGKPLESVEGVRLLREEAERAVIEVGSGSYSFEAQVRPPSKR